jgi:hypothetical protein
MEVWAAFFAVAFLIGLAPLPWWSVFACPLAGVGLGVYLVVTEPPNYDMHGLGYLAGGVAALISAIAWLAGRGVQALVRWWRHRRGEVRSTA